ncbi:MAG: hypothetical protein VXW32_06660 [Myxococcota bacterium]|nr:hypothetical protein [Myxococcota bacterium]
MDPLHNAVVAMKSGDYLRAIELLSDALEDVANSPQTRARAASLRSQAHLLIGSIQEALVDWRLAWSQVQQLSDESGQKSLRGLRREIAQAKAQRDHSRAQKAKSRALLESPAPNAGDIDSEDGLNLLLERANAHFDCDEPEQGVASALQLLEICEASMPIVRFQVLGRLCLLRGRPDRAEELLEACRDLADMANEPQLVGAVARAAKALGYEFAPHVF